MVLYTVSTDGQGTIILTDEMSGERYSAKTENDSDKEFARVVAHLTREYVRSQTDL